MGTALPQTNSLKYNMDAQDHASAIVRVPGSTSNIGPGFDCMGIALNVHNEVRLTRADTGQESPEHPMVRETAERLFREVNADPFPFTWSITGEVPISRGLGSSVTLRQGILQGLNHLLGAPLDRDGMFALATELEGHPDNASAGVYGGFTCTNASGKCVRFVVDPKLKFLLLIPERELLTEASRQCLPDELAHRDAVQSLGNACMITAAFATQDYELLRDSMDDWLHQPYRQAGNAGLVEVLTAGTAAGALGGFLSGSGSTMACVSTAEGVSLQRIAEAMRRAYSLIGEARMIITEANNSGATTIVA